MNNYIIYSPCISNNFVKSIGKGQYNELICSKEILSEALSKENIYNIVLMNYYEFEKELFEISLNYEIFSLDYPSFNNYKSKIELRILNLLSSITLYLESFKGDLQDTEKYLNFFKDEFEEVNQFITNSQNQKIKIMKYIRNHIQHNELLVDGISLNGVNLSDDLREQTLRFYVSKNKIKARYFKTDDFSDIEDEIDLKKIVREYMDFISTVHEQFRLKTDKKVQLARVCIEDVLDNYSDYKDLKVAKKVDDTKKEGTPLILDWDDTRLEMVKKNRVPKCFKRHSINTKVINNE